MKFFDRLKRKAAALRSDRFLLNVGVLATGTGLAQLVTLSVLPLLTRLYTPEDFSVLAVFSSIVAVISVIACLRLEVAIPLPTTDGSAIDLLALSLICSAVTSCLVFAVVIAAKENIAIGIGQPAFRDYLWLIPLGIWLASSYSAVQYWATRKKNFQGISRTRLTQAAGGGAIQLALGFMGIAPLGLLAGHLANKSAGIISLGRTVFQKDRPIVAEISCASLVRTFKQYEQFPRVSTIEAFANSAGLQIPILLIAVVVIGPEAGFLLLAIRVLQAPAGLIGGAVGQVYFSDASESLRRGELPSLTIDTIGRLVRFGLGPLLVVYFVAPSAFTLIFGAGWGRAGDLAQWMVPWVVLQFLASPVSTVMYVRERQKTLLALTIFGFFVRVSAILLADHFDSDFVSEAFILSSAFYYAICLRVFLAVAGVGPIDLADLARQVWLKLLLWGIFGYLFGLLIAGLAG